MCGIFGYIGNKNNSAEIIMSGLKTLEYRGYDSWGIAVGEKDSIKIEKKTGKIGSASVNLPKSRVGIGHTRWATHGGVTVENAHPHLSCDSLVALIHNGIVENYQTIKKNLHLSHRFKSETDTEIIAHLIEEELKEKSFVEAVRVSFKKLKGLNSIAVMHEGVLVVAKKGSPIVLGIGKSEYFLASDTSAIIPYTKKVMFLEDGQLATIDETGIKVFSVSDNKKIVLKPQILDWDVSAVSTGKYPHFMLKEIHEQPKIIRNAIVNLEKPARDLALEIKKARGTFFIASGTAFHACLAGTYLFSKIADYHVNTAVASEFNYLEDFLNSKSLIIALSQSGETIDVIEPLNRAKKRGSKIAAVVNTLGSTVYRMGDVKVLLEAGPEIAVASTKAYTAKLAFLVLVSYSLLGKETKGKELLEEAASEVERILRIENAKKIKSIAKILGKSDHIYTIGRGLSYPTALEAALKIKEVSYIHTEGLAGGELKHGTIALIGKNTPCMVFAPDDDTYDAIVSNAMEIKSRGGLMIGVGPKNSSVFDHWIEVRDTGDASVIPLVVPAQLLGYYLALERGLDPDKPRNLAKAVTVK